MMILLTGGSKCGKSSLAERLALHLAREASALLYLATMQVSGPEDSLIVLRHRNAREGKGFSVVEQGRRLDTLSLPPGAVLLLEDVPNVLANEMFGGDGPKAALSGIRHLQGQALHLLAVTNEVGSDGISYEAETLTYIRELGLLNQALADIADVVAEVVCGLPQLLKGVLPCS